MSHSLVVQSQCHLPLNLRKGARWSASLSSELIVMGSCDSSPALISLGSFLINVYSSPWSPEMEAERKTCQMIAL